MLLKKEKAKAFLFFCNNYLPHIPTQIWNKAQHLKIAGL